MIWLVLYLALFGVGSLMVVAAPGYEADWTDLLAIAASALILSGCVAGFYHLARAILQYVS